SVLGYTDCTAAGGTGTLRPTSWTENRTFCAATRSGGGCPSGRRCVPTIQSANACVAKPGTGACAAPYPTVSTASGQPWHTGVTDTRSCGPCQCSFGTGPCTGSSLQFFATGDCSGNPYTAGSGAEGNACAVPFTPQRARITGTVVNPSCPPQANITGEATPTGTQMVCCR
ncbi:MAG TPA: hypothetical protein VK524_05255, partial [Polyangiaceae bacterium]|nr:hypothetical protein [Polyangiaceae bacterium]